MPELPEVETVRRGLAEYILGKRIESVLVRRRDLREEVSAGLEEALLGREVEQVRRRAKYLILPLNSPQAVVMHLGMSGRATVRMSGSVAPQKHDHLVVGFAGGLELVFNDARRFGLVVLAQKQGLQAHRFFAHLGPEPFSEAFSPEYLAAALRRRKGAIKPVLMDQALVVGVGNIYACEVLFRLGMHPQTPSFLCANRAGELVAAIRQVLEEAIESGGSTLKDYATAKGESGYFQHSFAVYGREGQACFTCAGKVAKCTQAGRSSFFCPSCQPLG